MAALVLGTLPGGEVAPSAASEERTKAGRKATTARHVARGAGRARDVCGLGQKRQGGEGLDTCSGSRCVVVTELEKSILVCVCAFSLRTLVTCWLSFIVE